MNKKTKKIIAREFLIFLSMIFVGGLIICCHYPYNWIQQNRAEQLNKEIVDLEYIVDSLREPIKVKMLQQEWFYKEIESKYDVSIYETPEKMWELLVKSMASDSIQAKWTGRWNESGISRYLQSMGFKSATEFESFISINSLNRNDSLYLKQINSIMNHVIPLTFKKRAVEDQIIDGYQLERFSIIIGISLFVLMFLVRYLVYAIKWSFHQIKE